MADVTISNLGDLTPSGSVFIPVSNGSTTGKATVASLQVDYNNLTNKPVIPVGKVIASGGDTTQTLANGYKLHSFTSTGSQNFTVTNGGQVEFFLVGGGGGGGWRAGGGGGGGGVLIGSALVTPGTYTVTVGSGGTNASGDCSAGVTSGGDGRGGNGGNGSIEVS